MVHAKNSSQKSSDAQHCSGVTSGCWALPAPCDAPALPSAMTWKKPCTCTVAQRNPDTWGAGARGGAARLPLGCCPVAIRRARQQRQRSLAAGRVRPVVRFSGGRALGGHLLVRGGGRRVHSRHCPQAAAAAGHQRDGRDEQQRACPARPPAVRVPLGALSGFAGVC